MTKDARGPAANPPAAAGPRVPDLLGGVVFPCRGGCGHLYTGQEDWFMHFRNDLGGPSMTGATCPACASDEIVAVAEHNEAVARRWHNEAPPPWG